MVTSQLLEYIKSQQQNGFSRQDITQSLIDQGWQTEDINAAFNQTQSPQAQAPTPQTMVTNNESNKSGSNKKIITFALLGVLLLAGVAAATYFGYGAFVENSQNTSETTSQPQAEDSMVPTNEPLEENTTETKMEETRVYTNTEHGFSITPPETWITDESGLLGTLVAFYGETSSEQESEYRANITIITDSSYGLNLDDYVEAAKEQSSKLLQDYTIIEDERIEVNGQQAHLTNSSFTQGVFKITNYQLLMLKEDIVYILTASSSSDTWEEQKDMLRNSLLTLKFDQS